MKITKKLISPQFQAWMTNLSEYNFELRYRKRGGALNCRRIAQDYTNSVFTVSNKTFGYTSEKD